MKISQGIISGFNDFNLIYLAVKSVEEKETILKGTTSR
jgi:hypothetical protein